MKKRWPALMAVLVLIIAVFVYVYFLHPETVPMSAVFNPQQEEPQAPVSPQETTEPAVETSTENEPETTSEVAETSTEVTEEIQAEAKEPVAEEKVQSEQEVVAVFQPTKKEEQVVKPVTYLLFGRDQMVREENGVEVTTVETDLVLTATLDPALHKVDLLFIPPNTIQGEREVKHIYDQAGILSLTDTVADLTEKEIAGYMGVDYQSFVHLIDVLDGIEVELEDEIQMPKYGLTLSKGVNHLNGEETLKLMRLKWGKTTTIQRIERQKMILAAIFKKVNQMKNLTQLKEVSDAVLQIRKELDTDLAGNQILQGFQIFTQSMEQMDVEILPGELVNEEWIH